MIGWLGCVLFKLATLVVQFLGLLARVDGWLFKCLGCLGWMISEESLSLTTDNGGLRFCNLHDWIDC